MEWIRERVLLIVTSILLVLAMFSVKLIQNPYDYQSSQSSSYQTHLTVEQPKPQLVPVAGSGTHKPQANPKPERNEWRSERDLIAQTDMAKWAKRMFCVSVIMAILSAVGIWLILATLRATRLGTEHMQETLNQARIATTAAQESNRLSNIAIIVEHRPWLKLSMPNPAKLSILPDGTGWGLNVEVECKNTGKSIARRICTEWEFVNNVGQIEYDHLIARATKSAVKGKGGRSVDPSVPIPLYTNHNITHEEVIISANKIDTGDIAFVLSICVAYQNTFNEEIYYTLFSGSICAFPIRDSIVQPYIRPSPILDLTGRSAIT